MARAKEDGEFWLQAQRKEQEELEAGLRLEAEQAAEEAAAVVAGLQQDLSTLAARHAAELSALKVHFAQPSL